MLSLFLLWRVMKSIALPRGILTNYCIMLEIKAIVCLYLLCAFAPANIAVHHVSVGKTSFINTKHEVISRLCVVPRFWCHVDLEAVF